MEQRWYMRGDSMTYLNAKPRGRVQGDVAVIEHRQIAPDGKTVITASVDHMTLHALIAHAKLYQELADALLDQRATDKVLALHEGH